MGIIVEFNDMSNITYSEYVLTGFYILKEKGVIDRLKINYKPGVWPILFYKGVNAIKRILHMRLPSTTETWANIPGTIYDGKRRSKFIINILDTPWDFGASRLLDEADLIFKTQYPKDFKKGYARISKRVQIKLSEEIMRNSHKVRPLLVGRPLSRIFDFKKNKKILSIYEKVRKGYPRKYSVLVYLGMQHDPVVIENTHHPHYKRVDFVLYAHKNIPRAKIIFKPSHEEPFRSAIPKEAMELANYEKITDKYYLSLMQNSYSTLNITGLRGCISWRMTDAFLSGMVAISDNTYVEWYEPLIPGKDFLSLGDLGYELMEDIDFEGSCKKLKEYSENIEEIFKNTLDYRDERFRNYYSPEMAARYILREAGVL